MADFVSLLVPALASDERCVVLEKIYAARLANIDLSGIVPRLIDTAPAWQLPYLAEEFGVADLDAWRLALDDLAQRALIKRGIALRRLQGTPWAVLEVLRLMGVEPALTEWFDTGDARGTFAVTADAFVRPVTGALVDGAHGAIERAKALHAHLSRLQINSATRGAVPVVGAVSVMAIQITIYPRPQAL
jgi:phage tail P2-like protein